MQTVSELTNIWHGIVANHYDVAMKAWRAVDTADNEAEYLTTLIEVAMGMIDEGTL